MDVLGDRVGSETPSTSSEDFYNTSSPVMGSTMDPPQETLSTEHTQSDPMVDDQDGDAPMDQDSSSEMDLSDPSDDPEPEPEPEHEHSPHAGAKRRLRDTVDAADVTDESTDHTLDLVKRRRMSIGPSSAPAVNGKSRRLPKLPVEVVQHIFWYLPPAMLCRSLRVCKSFKTYLTETVAAPVPIRKVGDTDVRVLPVLASDAIWNQARKTCFPNLPRPLPGFTELQMLQLIGGKKCQFCNRVPVPSPATSPYNSGPGADGCRVIWSFGIRACGRCIESNTATDINILRSPVSSLRKGLPYIYLTPELHLVPDMQRSAPSGIPAHLRVTKRYYNKDVAVITREYDEARELGDGAAQEWLNGLEEKGKVAMTHAARWEKWESQLRYGNDLSQVLREYNLSSFPNYSAAAQSRSAGAHGTQPSAVANGTSMPAQPAQPFQSGFWQPSQFPNATFQQVPRPVRNPYEVEEARAARRADIERRCMELEPPLEADVLQHIDSFQAALQITTPMTDAAWEILKPRILVQREVAELVQHQRAAQLAALQAAVPFTLSDDYYTKPAKDVSDKKYDNAQEPLRKKLGEYADEYINVYWNGAQGLDEYNSPKFAVSTITHVSGRYHDDKQAGLLAFLEQPAKQGSKQGSPVQAPFLSLDNMKWVYDNKIKPLTDAHRRELFICPELPCAEERNPKWYAFEGLIQHYSAKHTTAFSKGNVVVHWRTAEWPDNPPFHQDPSKWIKPDRRASNKKGFGRTQSTPQNSHDGPFAAPGSTKLLSETAFFSSHNQPVPPASNGYHNYASGYQAYQNGQNNPYGAPYGFPGQPPSPAEPRVDMSHDAQLAKLSSDANEIWEALDEVKDLITCVRLQTVLHHVVVRFTERFEQRPTLDLITDALTLSPWMRSIKNARHLICKICVASQTDGSANNQSYYARVKNIKEYNASSLISHFKIMHKSQQHVGFYDWTFDMIEVPETELIAKLVRAIGMDDYKLALVADAFPTAFPDPLPTIGVVQETTPDPASETELARRLLDRINKKSKPTRKKKGQHGTNGMAGKEQSQEPLPEPKEYEYDPRRPMGIKSEEQTADPARFDTDIARKASSSIPPLSDGALGLAPETVSALNNLNIFAPQSQMPQVDDRRDRSPSVGRTDLPSVGPRPIETGSGTQPNIAAILASLTAHRPPAQTVTPATTVVSARAGSAPKYPYADPYGQPQQVSPRVHAEERRPGSRYAPQTTHRASVERYDGQDLQAAFAHNAGHFGQNRVQTYVEPSYSPPQQHYSQPQYRLVYDDGQQYSQQHPQQQAPIYHGVRAPVQYIQLSSEHERPPPPPPTYHHPYEQRPAKPIYVDELGRPLELIPIDNAPAPVQYAPHPYEQQQQLQQQVHARPAVTYAAATAPPQQALYEDRRPVYYEPAGYTAAPPQPPPVGYAAQAQRVYDDGARSSVPRS